MNILLLTGSHPRHLYIANALYQSGMLCALGIEQREQMIPIPPANLNDMDSRNFIRHFRDRDEAEQRAFGKALPEWVSIATQQNIPLLHFTPQELNSQRVIEWVRQLSPDMVITYGVHKIDNELLSQFPQRSWNIHGGLSPWYRGNTTLFWPFYFLQPNWAGITIHQLTSKLDAGAIIHHSVPVLRRGEGLHDVACNAVRQATEDLICILRMLDSGRTVAEFPQRTSGKLFTNRDWSPHHLRLIYNTFDNDIVDRFLIGEFGRQDPPLVKAF